MYKDPDKQREANRQAAKEYREKRRNAIEGMTTALKSVIPLSEACVIPKPELTAQGNIRVSKPGDDDYIPQCETTKAFIEGRDKRPETGKRGKDIKTFADLPPDVQQTIDSLSMVDGKICQRVKANRTAIAINYQHLFPDRFHSTGIAV